MAILSSIGPRTAHIEGPAKVTGRAKYRYVVAHFAGATVTQQAAGAPQAAITSQASIEAPATEPQQSAPAVATAAFGKPPWIGWDCRISRRATDGERFACLITSGEVDVESDCGFRADAYGSQCGKSPAPFSSDGA